MIELSALIATRNRAHLLSQVLLALTEQSLSTDRYEIVVVDDGSDDDTPSVLQYWADRLPLRPVRQRYSGIAAARNLAIYCARGAIMVFLDDDDLPDSDLLRVHLAAHLLRPEDHYAVLGRTKLSSALAADPLMHYVTEVGFELFCYPLLEPGRGHDYRAYWGGRSSCKRHFLIERGVFDPRFRFGFEDIELGWRLAKHGLEVIYEPAALSTMIRRFEFDAFCRRSYLQGSAAYRFATKHPCREIYDYCEVEILLNLWKQHSCNYRWMLDRARRLHALSVSRMALGLDPVQELTEALSCAYREAFRLCRSKGFVDANRGSPSVISY